MLDIKVNIPDSSEFNSEEHFYLCLIDLLEEWKEDVGTKEMDDNDAGFNFDRFEELRKVLSQKVSDEIK